MTIEDIEARAKAATLVVRLREGVIGIHYTSAEAADRIEAVEAQLRDREEKDERLLRTHDDVTLPELYEATEKLEAVQELVDSPRLMEWWMREKLRLILEGGD